MSLLLLVLCLVEAFAMPPTCEEEPLSTDESIARRRLSFSFQQWIKRIKRIKQYAAKSRYREKHPRTETHHEPAKRKFGDNLREDLKFYLAKSDKFVADYYLDIFFMERLEDLMFSAKTVEEYNGQMQIIADILTEDNTHTNRREELKEIFEAFQMDTWFTVLGYVGYFEVDKQGNDVYEDKKFHAPTVHDVQPTKELIKLYASRNYWTALNEIHRSLANRINAQKPTTIPDQTDSITAEEVRGRVQEVYNILNGTEYHGGIMSVVEGRNSGYRRV